MGDPLIYACSGMASPLLRDQPLRSERHLPGRYAFKRREETCMRLCSTRMISGVWSEASL